VLASLVPLDSVVPTPFLRSASRKSLPSAEPVHFGDVELTQFPGHPRPWSAFVGLALQATLGTRFAGIALHSEAPLHFGDWVRRGRPGLPAVGAGLLEGECACSP